MAADHPEDLDVLHPAEVRADAAQAEDRERERRQAHAHGGGLHARPHPVQAGRAQGAEAVTAAAIEQVAREFGEAAERTEEEQIQPPGAKPPS